MVLWYKRAAMMDRDANITRLCEPGKIWDIAVIGGGATGAAIAMDAAARGYSVALVEQSDFGKGTSSRSTKLIHGGVRYLQQGNIALVMEALRERGILRQNAPHLVHDLPFIIPSYAWWEAPFYGIGLKLYDTLAGRYGFGKSRKLSKAQVLEHIPTLEQKDLRSSVLYFDGQFDDSRLLIHMLMTADQMGAALVNYARVVSLGRDSSKNIDGFTFTDQEKKTRHRLCARAVVNATGAFCDAVRKFDDSGAEPMIAPSQGVHITLDRKFLPGDSAIMVPHTSDGRVMFAIPWHGHVLLGTTDTPIEQATLEPVPMDQEIEFILQTASLYLATPPKRSDILSVFAGIRPLVKTGNASSTKSMSRDHTISISESGLITIAGGKWTTCRRMAQDCVNQSVKLARLKPRACTTKRLHIHGYHRDSSEFGDLQVYGSDAVEIRKLMRREPSARDILHERFPIVAAQVVWAVRHEMARTVDDVLARRTRVLMLDAKAAIEMAPMVARLIAAELELDSSWEARQIKRFKAIARNYLPFNPRRAKPRSREPGV
jgi:glycerol-3-phosphate dehydrogenase